MYQLYSFLPVILLTVLFVLLLTCVFSLFGRGGKRVIIGVCTAIAVYAVGCILTKDVSCKAETVLTVVNTTGKRYKLTFENVNKNKTEVSFLKDSLYIGPTESVSNTINYRWIGNQDCILGSFTVDMNVYDTTLLVESHRIYPYDTLTETARSHFVCNDCLNTFRDTIILESKK